MNGASITLRTIGVIHSEHHTAEETPIQPVYARGCLGIAEVFPEFAEGLQDLEGYSHIYLLYHLHCASEAKLRVKPFLQDVERGVFSTRAPCRPNPIGLSIVELVKVEGNLLHLDGTPLLDIKPYAARFDCLETSRNGWHEEVEESDAQRRGRRGYRGGQE